MNRRIGGIVLLIAGVLLFLWAGAQISNFISPALLPFEMVQQQEQQAAIYRTLQIVGALAAIGGGGLIFLKQKTTPAQITKAYLHRSPVSQFLRRPTMAK